MTGVKIKYFLKKEPMKKELIHVFWSSSDKCDCQNRELIWIINMPSVQHHEGKDKFIFGSPDYNPGKKEKYNSLLFPYDYDGQQPNYLYIYFPKRSGYLIKGNRFYHYSYNYINCFADCYFCVYDYDNFQTEKIVDD